MSARWWRFRYRVRNILADLSGRDRTLRCKNCGYLVPYVGDPNEQANRAFTHWEVFHDRIKGGVS